VKASNATRDEARRLNVRLILRGIVVLTGALLMAWPALYNSYPLLYPDSISYLEDGRLVARALFLHRFSADYGGKPGLHRGEPIETPSAKRKLGQEAT
jgi:hypothetical protein